MGILMILYVRMGLSIRQTSGIQRNLPARSASVAMSGPPHTFEQGIFNSNSSPVYFLIILYVTIEKQIRIVQLIHF